MLYTLERGNLIIPCFTFFVLGNGRVLRSAKMKWLSLAAAINFKPYIVIVLVAHLVRRRWRWVEGCTLAIVFVYLASFALEGAGTPTEIWADIVVYAQEVPNAFILAESYYSSSYTPVISLLSSEMPLMNGMGSSLLETLGALLPLLIHIGQLGVAAAMFGAAVTPRAVPFYRLGAMSIALVLTSTDPGGYTQVFLLFFLFFERWRGGVSIAILVCAYILSISGDYELIRLDHNVRDIYLTGQSREYPLGVNIGHIVRPLIILIIEYCLAISSLGAVWRTRRQARSDPGAIVAAPSVA